VLKVAGRGHKNSKIFKMRHFCKKPFRGI
jgi:hypothetical protein